MHDVVPSGFKGLGDESFNGDDAGADVLGPPRHVHLVDVLLVYEGGPKPSRPFVWHSIVQFGPLRLCRELQTPPSFGVSVEPASGSIDSWIKKEEAWRTKHKNELEGLSEVVTFTRTSVNNVDAVALVGDTGMGRIATFSYALFPRHKPFVYLVNAQEGSGSSVVPAPFELLRLMMQTFRFIE